LFAFGKRELERHSLEGLHSNNPGSRLWSIIILRKYINYNGFKNIYNDKFMKMIKDPEESVRYEALISLALCSHGPLKYLNRDILEDPSHKVKTFANILYQDRIEALHTILSKIIPLNIEKIKQSVNGKPIDDAEEILKVLGELRSVKSIPYFLDAYLPYDDDGLGLNELIEELLENFTDEELIPYLLHALEKGNLGSKAISLLMLGCIRNTSFIPNIKQFLVHENEEIRIKTLEALSIMDDRSVLPDIVYVMEHDLSPRVREEAEITFELLSREKTEENRL
jgi:hypothetical protein